MRLLGAHRRTNRQGRMMLTNAHTGRTSDLLRTDNSKTFGQISVISADAAALSLAVVRCQRTTSEPVVVRYQPK
jgi:hypothetical protein